MGSAFFRLYQRKIKISDYKLIFITKYDIVISEICKEEEFIWNEIVFSVDSLLCL